jgi:PIN domain nuclease of toxin-antitoxin system
VILLDTHVLVWLDEGSSRLGGKALQLIDRALAEEALVVSAISFWEVAMLVRKGRLALQGEVEVWRRELLAKGVREIPLHGGVAIRAATLRDFHGDPADRLIVSTALEMSAALATADERILAWEKLPGGIDARR